MTRRRSVPIRTRPGPSINSFSYVYLRDNPAGAHRELWYHGAGCQAWLAVERDTLTHAIAAVDSYKAGA